MTREICKACWKINRIGFIVPNEIWNKSVPNFFKNKVLCLDCFTTFADEAGIEWDKDIKFFPVSFLTHLKSNEDANT